MVENRFETGPSAHDQAREVHQSIKIDEITKELVSRFVYLCSAIMLNIQIYFIITKMNVLFIERIIFSVQYFIVQLD